MGQKNVFFTVDCIVHRQTQVLVCQIFIPVVQWKNNLGINVDINMVPYATRNALLVPDSDEYDIIMSGWAPDYSDPYSYLELWYSTSGYNYLNYHSDEYDKYIDASKTTSGKERMDNLLISTLIPRLFFH